MKIYTKTGDDGTTGLFSGRRVPKSSSYLEAYGSVDELNAFVGFAAVVFGDESMRQILYQIQHDLHVVCADLATPMDAKAAMERVNHSRTKRLEDLIDELEKELEPLTQFILAGGTELAARLHIARTVARRAERSVIQHSEKEKVNPEVPVYLNRLSDFLFVLSRVANKRAHRADVVWDKTL